MPPRKSLPMNNTEMSNLTQENIAIKQDIENKMKFSDKNIGRPCHVEGASTFGRTIKLIQSMFSTFNKNEFLSGTVRS